MSLRELCVGHVARDFATRVDVAIFEVLTQEKEKDDETAPIRDTIDKYGLESLPEELLSAVWNRVERFSAQCGVIAGCFLSKRLKYLRYDREESSYNRIPLRILNKAVLFLSSATTSLDWNNLCIEDETLLNLSQSEAADSLRTLSIAGSLISDSTASCWAKFSSLSSVNVSNCLLLGPQTLREIVKLPSLIDFTFDYQHSSDIVPLLPAQLEQLNLWSKLVPPMFIDDALAQLQSRGILENLSSLSLLHQHWSLHEISKWKELRARYPKLEHYGSILSFDELKVSMSSFAGLRSLKLECGSMMLTQDHVLNLSRMCPELESLYLDVTSVAHDLSLWPFSALRSLMIKSCGYFDCRIKGWPPALTSLEIKDVGRFDSQIPYPEFLSCLSQSCRELKHLKFTGSTNWSFDASEVLASFPGLETLVLPLLGVDQPPIQKENNIRDNCQHLRHFQGSLLPFGQFPSLEVCRVELPMSAARVTAATTPFLHHVDLNLILYIPKSSHDPVDDAIESFSQPGVSLRSLTLDGAPTPYQLKPLAYLSLLSSLKLKFLTIPSEVLSELMSGLKMLQLLEISLPSGSTLQHKALISLKLRVGASNWSIDSKSLPALQKLVVLPTGTTEWEIDELHHLRTIKMTNGTVRCPSKLNISRCARLKMIHLVNIIADAESSITECPSFKKVELEGAAKLSVKA